MEQNKQLSYRGIPEDVRYKNRKIRIRGVGMKYIGLFAEAENYEDAKKIFEEKADILLDGK